MASQLTQHPTVAPIDETVLPLGVMENLAGRYRTGGLCVIVLRPDGSVIWHDGGADAMFQRFLIPLLQNPHPAEPRIADAIARLSPSAVAVPLAGAPGMVMVAFPHHVRRHIQAVVLLAGKDEKFALNEDVLRICSRLGLDAVWLKQHAAQLPSYGREAITRQSRLLQGALRDQLRMHGLEQELNTLSTQLSNTYEELSLVYQLSGGMKVNRRPSEFFKEACNDVLEVMGVQSIGVVFRRDVLDGQEAIVQGPLTLMPGHISHLGEVLLTRLQKNKKPLVIDDLARDKEFNWLADAAKTMLAVPLQCQDQMLGAYFALEKNKGEFDSVDAKLLTSIANESAIYLQNAILFGDVRGLMMGLLHSLSSAVDAKDAYTCGHSERVALLARHLAIRLGHNDHDIERTYMAGLLHDVGKIGVPESVLQKAGKLTSEEYEQMKRHPLIGARILQDIPQIADVVPGVLHHHERYDGRGYPAGLTGENIPLLGRIICLADGFDAMTSSRTYRLALPMEVAMTELRRCSGTQFDPALTEVFLQIGPDGFRQLRDQHQVQTKNLQDLQQMLRSAQR